MNCISYNMEYGRFMCEATENEQCFGTTCAFYRTQEDKKESLQKAYERLRSLPEEEQRRISDTYYNGRQPWKEER